MSNRLERGIRASGKRPPRIRNDTTVATLTAAGCIPQSITDTSAPAAMKLSSVDRCIEVLSDSMGKLPIYVMDRKTRERVDHPLGDLLTIRPNEAQTPTVAKKMMEGNRNCGGNGYSLIIRSSTTLEPESLLPVPYEYVTPWLDTSGRLWYSVIHPYTGTPMTVHRMDMLHTMAYTHNGYKGISVLSRASEVISAGRAAQQYNLSYYANGGQPSGVLRTDADLTGKYKEVPGPDGKAEQVPLKDIIRDDWDRHHAGPTNAQRIAILDFGLDYKPISISNRDAQFVEQSELSVQDIARFFGVPLYKLQSGKQSYNSNEQNAIEYVVSTLHPIVSQYEEELTYKLLPTGEAKRLRIRINMMAELKGDVTSRAGWYRAMREIGGYSVNDILALEDLPDVEGGDEHYASLNYVPLALWRELSINRNNNQGGGERA